MRKQWIIPVLISVCTAKNAAAQEEVPSEFEVYKNLELFGLVYSSIDLNYVDPARPGQLIKTAIDAMLRELDPYTVYIPESRIEDYTLMAKSQYGGVGASIQRKGDASVITDLYENYPAQKAGLLVGDVLTTVDGQSVESLRAETITERLKGAPKSPIQITVKRGDQEITVDLLREEIAPAAVPFYGVIGDRTGYIQLHSFTKTAAREIEAAFAALKKEEGIEKLVLDLRGNPGGLLVEAVKIVNFFVPRGQEIVRTKGKGTSNNRSFKTQFQPLDLRIPIAVLIDEHSASAAEIVAGSLQDLDRGVVVGQTSFGKGLVQQTFDLDYNAKLKATIAKYYTPSGRCIQRLDYSNRTGDTATAVADELIQSYLTKNGRRVIDGRGVEPDVSVSLPERSRLTQSLVEQDVLFDFATAFRRKNESVGPPGTFRISAALYREFTAWAMSQEFAYNTASNELMQQLKAAVQAEGRMEGVASAYEQLAEKLTPSKERDLVEFKDEIAPLLATEIIGRYHFQKGQIEHRIQGDPFVESALKILGDTERYSSILRTQK